MGNKEVVRYGSHNTGKLIDLAAGSRPGAPGWFLRKTARPLEYLLGVRHINAIYREICRKSPMDMDAGTFFDAALNVLNIDVRVSDRDLSKIPADGPLVAVANHPFGGAEGIILGKLFFDRRRDIKILGNYLLTRIPQIRTCIASVNPFGARSSVPMNAAAFRGLVGWVKNGGALISFPAGEVAHFQPGLGRVTDRLWSPHMAAIIRMARARVLPVYFPGNNSVFFHLLGLLHPRLRTGMLLKELINKKGTAITVRIGKPISWSQLKRFDSRQSLTEYLRFTTFFLKHRTAPASNSTIFHKPEQKKNRAPFSPVAAAASPSLLRREIGGFSKDKLLVRHQAFDVYCGTAEQMPNVMHEIARLRELSFRDVDEGTGRPFDRDAFDDDYLQLFLWHRKTCEIAGAYRLGITEDLLARRGVAGLYTHSLFQFKSEFIRNLCHSVELGRSFIHPSYQRKHGCLSLLWRGIGEFILRHPQVHILFGPVSISRNYHVVSRNLIVSFLRNEQSDDKFSPWVKARNPLAPEFVHRFRDRIFRTPIGSIKDISMLISEIEKDGKGIPPLIKHYLKLDGKFIGFNVDRNFSNVVDGLVMVDLLRTEHRLLKRFMGTEGFLAYWAHHRSAAGKAA